METSASLVNTITDNAVFHSSSHINQILPRRSHYAFFSDRHTGPDFVVNWIRSGLFGGHKSGSSYE